MNHVHLRASTFRALTEYPFSHVDEHGDQSDLAESG